ARSPHGPNSFLISEMRSSRRIRDTSQRGGSTFNLGGDTAHKKEKRMARRQHVWHGAGYTLVELLVVMAVMGIVSSVTAVNVGRQLPRYRLTNAASQLAWTFRGLRMRAISQHHTVQVTFTNTHIYTIWTDRNDNGTIESDEVQTVDINMAYPSVQLAST